MQVLLSKAYPVVSGLQDTTLGSTLSFNIMKEEFVQVLHSGGNHWITVTNIGCPLSSIRVCDSLYANLPTQTKEQICALLFSEEPSIEIVYASVQSQKNAVDCGPFSLAFAPSLCVGQHPESLLFNGSCLRPHILKCLEDEKVTLFPYKALQRGTECQAAQYN